MSLMHHLHEMFNSPNFDWGSFIGGILGALGAYGAAWATIKRDRLKEENRQKIELEIKEAEALEYAHHVSTELSKAIGQLNQKLSSGGYPDLLSAVVVIGQDLIQPASLAIVKLIGRSPQLVEFFVDLEHAIYQRSSNAVDYVEQLGKNITEPDTKPFADLLVNKQITSIATALAELNEVRTNLRQALSDRQSNDGEHHPT